MSSTFISFFFDGHINLKDDSPIKKNLNTFLIKKKKSSSNAKTYK